MAKLYFMFSAMDSGKSTQLIQNVHNYQSRGMPTLVFKPKMDSRDTTEPLVTCRIGLSTPAHFIPESPETFYTLLKELRAPEVKAIFVDEAQFVSPVHLKILTELVDRYDVPVLCYGLRNSYDGEGFPGSDYLLRHAEKLVEVKTVCFCGVKATHNLMVVDGKAVHKTLPAGNMVVGGNELYHSVCRKHFLRGQYK